MSFELFHMLNSVVDSLTVPVLFPALESKTLYLMACNDPFFESSRTTHKPANRLSLCFVVACLPHVETCSLLSKQQAQPSPHYEFCLLLCHQTAAQTFMNIKSYSKEFGPLSGLCLCLDPVTHSRLMLSDLSSEWPQ